jgi:hypothetical protein
MNIATAIGPKILEYGTPEILKLTAFCSIRRYMGTVLWPHILASLCLLSIRVYQNIKYLESLQI